MGLILVFDLDQTIASPAGDNDIIVNDKIIEILGVIQRANLRGNGVDAIFLLTNNSSAEYIKWIDGFLLEQTKSIGKFKGGDDYPEDDYFFDYIMDYNNSTRNGDRLTKSLNNIKVMVDKAGIEYITDKDLLTRIYFFDDLDHVIKDELAADGLGNQYIKITPPLEFKKKDLTDYNPIYAAIRNLMRRKAGGKRSCYKKRRTLRKLRTTKKRRV